MKKIKISYKGDSYILNTNSSFNNDILNFENKYKFHEGSKFTTPIDNENILNFECLQNNEYQLSLECLCQDDYKLSILMNNRWKR